MSDSELSHAIRHLKVILRQMDNLLEYPGGAGNLAIVEALHVAIMEARGVTQSLVPVPRVEVISRDVEGKEHTLSALYSEKTDAVSTPDQTRSMRGAYAAYAAS